MGQQLFPVVILAGGLATRLKPLSNTIPKSLIKINEEPFILHQLRLLQKNGVKKVILCVGYLSEKIVNFINNYALKELNISISYSFDGPSLLGTAGAIKKALPLAGENFFVLYGDSYLPCHYFDVQAAFIKSNKKALMTVFHNDGIWDKSNIEFQNGNILKYNKKEQTENMHHIDYGLSLFNETAFSRIENDTFCDLECVFQSLLKVDKIASIEIKERFYEVGSFSGIKELENYLSSRLSPV